VCGSDRLFEPSHWFCTIFLGGHSLPEVLGDFAMCRLVEILSGLRKVKYRFFVSQVGACPHPAVHRLVNTGPDTQDNVRKAFESALKKVGHYKDSGELWIDYIQFLKSVEVKHRRNRLFPSVCSCLIGRDPIGRKGKDGRYPEGVSLHTWPCNARV
jgi:hypothetical protein